ncbi:helix-turn-helix domain-containing protein [Leeuwenhoekiella polynyae]|uniref:Helix-turn-helix protein n=1 Tax=Leeuwenhoekiella polynyae TaxID=1550906 RepID=A0A4Q0P803_9FLAO|nr:AraC family transcriptional regulator [Leeuwenhoekiella polynyae]RXG22276.1 helix-turn-helix protein [Leeuwenhoekiella polynyae]
MNSKHFTHTFSLLNIDCVELSSRWDYKNVISPYYRIYYIETGSGVLASPSKKLNLRAGHLYLIPSFTLCDFKCTDYMQQYFVQFFEESPDTGALFKDNREVMELPASETEVILFKKLLKLNPGRGINRSDNPEIYEKEAFYKEYQNLNRNMKASVQFETQGIILILLSRFIESIRYSETQSRKIPSVVLDAMNYIQLNLNQAITVTELAEKANQNRDYFSREFLEHTGKRPLAYIHEKRIERAQYLIVTTNKTLLDIAIETGFNNLPHFNKVFKKHLNSTPGAYRKQNLKIT